MTHLRAYRRLLLIGGVLLPLFWLIHRFSNPHAYDPIWIRGVFSGIAFAGIGLSYVSDTLRRHLRLFLYWNLYLITSWFLALTALNHFTPNYAVGLMLLMLACGVATGVGVTRSAPVAGYLLFASLATAGAALLTPAPEMDPVMLTGSVMGMALVIYVATRARIRARRERALSEERFRAAAEGSLDVFLLLDIRRGDDGQIRELEVIDMNTRAADLVGCSRIAALGQSLRALLPLYQSPPIFARLTDAADAGEPVEEEFAAPDGEKWFQHQTVPIDEGLALTLRDITTRKRHEEQLIAAKEQAEEMLRLKSDILNNISHEVRTPLSGVMGFAEVLSENLSGEDSEFAEHITQNARRLQRTLNSILDMARLERGEVAVEMEPVKVAEEVREAATLFRSQAERNGLMLRLDISAPEAHAYADDACLHRILSNLTHNAVKFTDEGHVTLAVEAEAEQVCLQVRDTGEGISEDFLPHLFDEFRQQSRGLDRSHEGSGLGLAITRRLVGLMDGDISVESEKGVGTTFTISLPRARPAEEEKDSVSASSFLVA